MRRSLVLFSIIVLSACASVTKGTTQSVLVSTPGLEGASCSLVQGPVGKAGRTYHVMTPGSVAVDRSRHPLDVRCTKEGYAEGHKLVHPGFEAMTLGNVLIGGVVGLGIDAASGAINQYPDSIQVEMKAVEVRSPEPANTVKADDPTHPASLEGHQY